jgi:ribosome-binding factor A
MRQAAAVGRRRNGRILFSVSVRGAGLLGCDGWSAQRGASIMLHSRIDRVQSLIQSELGAILDRDLNNPKIPHFITVYQVKVSKDLSTALVLVTFLQDISPEAVKETITELNHSASYIRRLLSQRVQLKRHPALKFAYTDSTKYALDIEKVFQKIKSEPPVSGGDPVSQNPEERQES